MKQIKIIEIIKDVFIVACCVATLVLFCQATLFVRELNKQVEIENRQMIGVESERDRN